MPNDSINFLTKDATARRVGYHHVHLMRMVKEGRFPAPVQVGPGRIGFVEAEVTEWQRARIAERDARLAQRKAEAEGVEAA